MATFANSAKEAGVGIRDFRAPGGESWKDVNSRARDFTQKEILQKAFGGNF